LGYVRSKGGLGKEKSTMADQEVRATHEEVEGFVTKLRDFHGSLSESEQAMLETVLQSAQSQDTGAYGMRVRFSSQGGGWEEAGRRLGGSGRLDGGPGRRGYPGVRF
jgi:hypothetical protein